MPVERVAPTREDVSPEPADVGAGDTEDWVHEAIALTRPGVEIQFPLRRIDDRELPFAYDDFR